MGIETLSQDEKAILIDQLWTNWSKEASESPSWQIELAEKSLKKALDNPSSLSDWEEVKERLAKRNKK